ncbi:unnamed protein product [Peniophora sp. CBMAI 1063]|nr:unnamed protein product [Peniophora sp. CBMAI 1063]
MSRADSTSPPPYSYENSSFAPPPPRADEISRSWDFQVKFEAAPEDVRWAILDTITAWKVHGRGLPWDYIPRSDVQDAYDAAPNDLKIALDYIVLYNVTTYFSDDMDRRQHDYFRRRDDGWPAIGGGRKLLTAVQFMQDFYASANTVQKAILMTFATWDQRRTQVYEEPRLDHLRLKYEQASEDKKILLNWMLESGADYGIATLRMIPSHEESTRRAFDRIHETRRHASSLFRR